MNPEAKKVQRTYLTLILLATFANSFIWGINTLFLLDAGLSITEAFIANTFFTVGMLIFEVPTGVIADTWGRRASYLLGAATLLASTLLYLLLWQFESPLWMWSVVSVFLGFGYTFFSGAVEAWLVDALDFTKYKGALDSVFAKGQIASGIAMLSGSVAGGVIAQLSNLGVPFILRIVMLLLTFIAAFIFMKDLGFKPRKATSHIEEMKLITKASIDNGIKNPPVRWVMFTAPFSLGVGVYAFYAMQPYLLELYGDPTAYSIAGLAAAIIAGAQIAGGLLVNRIRKLFKFRTSILLSGIVVSVFILAVIGLTNNFWVAVVSLVVWAMVFAATMPVKQGYINGLIPSKQRATVLSFDSLMGSGGGVVTQPVLGRVADVYSLSSSYVVSAGIQLGALPFMLLAKKEKAKSDPVNS